MTMRMFSLLRAACSLLLLLSLLLGAAYPLTVLSVAKIIFPAQAGGSLVVKNDKVVGSALLGQSFTAAKYFWARPSATTPPHNAAASAASNLSPANPQLLAAVNARIAALQKHDPRNKLPVPADLVMASASGLDPHISLEGALYQLSRVARARGMKDEEVRVLLTEHTENWLGRRYVNVLELNMALDGK